MPLYIQYTFTCTRLEHVRSIRYGSVPRIPKDYARLFPFLELWVFCSFYVVCFRNPVYSSERAAIELWLRIHTPRNNKELTKESKFYRLYLNGDYCLQFSRCNCLETWCRTEWTRQSGRESCAPECPDKGRLLRKRFSARGVVPDTTLPGDVKMSINTRCPTLDL